MESIFVVILLFAFIYSIGYIAGVIVALCLILSDVIQAAILEK